MTILALSVTPPTLTDTKIKKGYAFDPAQSEFIDTADINALDGATALTVMAWIYSPTWSADKTIVSKWDYATQGNFGFQTMSGYPNKLSLFIATSLGDTGIGCRVDGINNDLINGQWNRVAFVFDGTKTGNGNRLKMYVNGSPIAETMGAGNVPAALTSGGTATLKIGKFGGSITRYFLGTMDDVRVITRAFSDTEMTTDYANQNNPATFWTTGAQE